LGRVGNFEPFTCGKKNKELESSWKKLAQRTSFIVQKETDKEILDYRDLASRDFKGRICLRNSDHYHLQSLKNI
jgi:hypothetical protein